MAACMLQHSSRLCTSRWVCVPVLSLHAIRICKPATKSEGVGRLQSGQHKREVVICLSTFNTHTCHVLQLLEDAKHRQAHIHWQNKVAAWQSVLATMFPAMAVSELQGPPLPGSRGCWPGFCLCRFRPGPSLADPLHMYGAHAALFLLHVKLSALPSQVHTPYHAPPQGEQVADVLDSRSNRTVLLTNAHVVLLKASTKNKQTIYRTKWCLPISEVQNIRGKLHCPSVLALVCLLCPALLVIMRPQAWPPG